ncbi:MAG: hypothetical protein V3S82_00240 [Dehalococcoidia bacterium]
MSRTGIFLTYFQGQRLRDFPEALGDLLSRDNVFYYDAVYSSWDGLYYLKPASEALLERVHSREMIARVRSTGDYESALYSAGGTVQAAEEIWRGDIDNAFIFTSFGDHHAGRDFFGGMCYFNGAALAIAALRSQGMVRSIIVDTDAHHADGTRDIFGSDSDVLHVCLCSQGLEDDLGNIDVPIPPTTTDDEYLGMLKRALVPRALDFQPEVIFWEFGYDGTQGEYGDRGLSPDCHIRIAGMIKDVADKVCGGRLVAILCGGSGRRTASYTIPRIIDCLAGGKDNHDREVDLGSE